MIEYKNLTARYGDYDYFLFVDGIVHKDGYVEHLRRHIPDGKVETEMIVTRADLSKSIAAKRISDITESIKAIAIGVSYSLIESEPAISQSITLYRDNTGQSHIAFTFFIAVESWKRLWSITEYQLEFEHIFIQHKPARARWSAKSIQSASIQSAPQLFPKDRITFSLPVHNVNTTVEAEARNHANVINQLHMLTEASLLSKLRQESVVFHFNFPEEVRVPCEQYLLYFVQFLKDLGVEATADIQHEAGQVLFEVTPADKQTALDKIRTALETYLQLPSNPAADDASIIEYEIAEQRLAANIDHLKGQLRLAHAELRLAGATIQTQQVAIDHLLSGKIIVESLKDVTPKAKEEDKEELLSGTVALTKVNWKGVEFNLPEIFRKLRRLFKDDE